MVVGMHNRAAAAASMNQFIPMHIGVMLVMQANAL
jgi:hypothetical protein